MTIKITLVQKDKIVGKDKNVAKVMNKFFISITKTLNKKSSKNSNNNDIMELISQFHDHESIKKNERKLFTNNRRCIYIQSIYHWEM